MKPFPRLFQHIAKTVLILGAIILWAQTSSAQQQFSISITAQGKNEGTLELSPSDLEIKRDGKQMVVQDVHRLSNVPVHYCVVFDTSKSETHRFRGEQLEALAVLAKVVHAGDQGILYDFNIQSHLDAESTNPQDLANAVMQTQPDGGTALYDAIVSCANHMAAEPPDSGRRAMFIFSDGDDNQSHVDIKTTLSVLLKAGIKAYAIGQLDSPAIGQPGGPEGEKVLIHFAEKSGGGWYFASQEKDIDKIVANLSATFANVFSITFTSAEAKQDGQLHKLEIKSKKKNISIQAPESYQD